MCETTICHRILSEHECPPHIVGTLWTEEDSDDRGVHHWKVKKFPNRVQNGICLSSHSFPFGAWPLESVRRCSFSGGLLLECDSIQDIEVGLAGPYDCFDPFEGNRYSLGIAVVDSEGRALNSTQCMWTEGYQLNCRLLLGHPYDVRHLLLPGSSLEVVCKLHLISENASPMAVHRPGEHESVGTLNDEITRKMWNVPDFGALAEKGRLCSGSFAFATRQWQLQLHVSSPPGRPQVDSGAAAERDVVLSLESVSGQEKLSPFVWKIWLKKRGGTVLRREVGMCGVTDDHATFSLGPLPDVQRMLGTDGILKVVCDLRPLQRHYVHFS